MDRLWWLYMIVVLDMAGASMTMPLLPYFVKEFYLSSSFLGLMGTTYALLQLVGSILLGRYSDSLGRRFAFVLCASGSVLAYLLLFLSWSPFTLLLSRVPVGLCKQTITISCTIIADLIPAKDRQVKIGRVTAAASLGLVLGPLIGGRCATHMGHRLAVLLSTAAFLLELILIVAFVTDKRDRIERKCEDDAQSDSAAPRCPVDPEVCEHCSDSVSLFVVSSWLNPLHAFCRRMRSISVSACSLIAAKFTVDLALTFFRESITYLALNYHHFSPAWNGYIISFRGGAQILTQSILLPLIVIQLRFSGIGLILSVLPVTAAMMISVALQTSGYAFIANIVATTMCIGLVDTTLTSTITSFVPVNSIGSFLGLASALQSGAQIMAPLVSGMLQDRIHAYGPLALSALCISISWSLLFRHFSFTPKLKT